MSTIPQNNFIKFLSKELNLSSNVYTDSLTSISHVNFFSRIFNSGKLDSENICKNIEATINTSQPLAGPQKEMAIKNLTAMRAKFSKSNYHMKMHNCAQIINRIIDKINLPSTSQSPITLGSFNPTLKQPSAVSLSSKANTRTNPQPVQHVISQSVVNPTSKVLRSAQNQDASGANKKLVEAISQMNKKTETTTTTSIQLAPDMSRIAEIEKGVTEEDRKSYFFKRHLIYYRHEDKYYFNALQVKGQGFSRTCTQVLVDAKEVNQQVQNIKQSGTNDIGALLRMRMQEMNIDFKETN